MVTTTDGVAGAVPTVFIHGLGTASDIWEGCLPAVPDGITVDLPGYAGCPPPEDSSVESYAAAVVRQVDLLKHKEMHLVGHSMGCLIAATLATQLHGRVRSLVLVSPSLGLGACREPERTRMVRERLAPLEDRTPREWAVDNVERLLSTTASDDIRRRAAAYGTDLTKKGISGAVQMMSRSDLLRTLARVRSPVLAVYGTDDITTPASTCLPKILSARPNIHTHLIEKCGHLPPLERPEELSHLITSFTKEISQ